MIAPYYEDSAVKIYHGDCFELLPDLGRFDLLLTDPPYVLNLSGGNKGCFEGELEYVNKTMGFTDCGVDYSFLAGHDNFFVFCSTQQLPDLLPIAKSCGNYKLLKWIKPNCVPLVFNTYLPDTEYIVHCWQKGRLFGAFQDKSTNIVCNAGNHQTSHPNEKPLFLLSRLITLGSQIGETILDPFMGSGTTLRAAKDRNRKAIGIEIEEKYCEIAANRMCQEVLAL